MKKVINILFNDFTNDNRVMKECRTLKNNGYKVELVATHFDNSLPEEEKVEGITVKRVNVGRIKFLTLNLFLFWVHIVLKYKNQKMFHCNDLYGLPPAWFIKTFLNKEVKIVYDCHEHETEAQIYIGNTLLHWAAKVSERAMIYSTDKVIVVSESIADDYVKMYGIERPELVMNCPQYKNYKNTDYLRKEFNIPKDHMILFYVGIYKQGRGLENLIELFSEARKKNKKISLVLLTWGDDTGLLHELIKRSPDVYWHDRAPLDVFMNYVASADWGVLLLENISKNNDFALPNKLFDYIMAQLPVIVSDLKEMSRFVKENKVGYVVNSDDDKEVIEVLSKVSRKTKMSFLSNIEITRKKYNWEEQEETLLKLYKSI
ncbi:MAG: glycosyltransferase [bacterium]